MLTKNNIRDIKSDIVSRGFSDLGVNSNLNLLECAKLFGKPVPIMPGEPELGFVGGRSESKNLSSNEYAVVYAGKNIPLHTDAAYFRIPPRIVMLKLKETSFSNRSTILVNPMHGKPSFSELLVLRRSLWRIYGGNKLIPFAGHILERCDSIYFFRYDMNCMKPYFRRNVAGKHVIKIILKRCQEHEIQWKPGQTIIFDNWKMLHGTGPVYKTNRTNRILERVLVDTYFP
jgi:hypothetical protein